MTVSYDDQRCDECRTISDSTEYETYFGRSVCDRCWIILTEQRKRIIAFNTLIKKCAVW